GAVAGTVVGAIVGAVAVADASWPPASGFGRASASLRQEAEVVHNRLQIQRLAVVVVLDVAEGVHDDQHVGGRELVLLRRVMVVRVVVAVGAGPRSVLLTAGILARTGRGWHEEAGHQDAAQGVRRPGPE